MTLYYLDTSVWVKRYLTEAGSVWIRKLFDLKEPFACSELGYVEASAAIARQRGIGKISPDRQEDLKRNLLADWEEMLHVPLGPNLMHQAAELSWQHKLRGADAIHLAAAWQLQNQVSRRCLDFVLLTADAELIRAAQELHLAVTNPAELT